MKRRDFFKSLLFVVAGSFSATSSMVKLCELLTSSKIKIERIYVPVVVNVVRLKMKWTTKDLEELESDVRYSVDEIDKKLLEEVGGVNDWF